MPKFSEISKRRLDTCHSDLIRLMNECIKDFDFTILCGHRGEQDQEKACREGKSKVHWPNSKHNQEPSLAVDIVPFPVDWGNVERFNKLASHVHAVAENLGIKIRWGGDFRMDGDKTTDDSWDMPHFELVDPT